MNPLRHPFAIAGLAAALALSSCAKKKGQDQWDQGAGWDDGSGSYSIPSRGEGGASWFGPGSGSVQKGQFANVYFDFDSFAIKSSEIGKVASVAEFLRASSDNLIVAGFTDQVGTDEYNRVLGERRALAVRDALMNYGVEAGRIQTVSFGEDYPAEPGNDAANRRVEFGVVR